MWRNISKESLYRNLHWEKGTFFTPKNQAESLSQRRRTCTKNQKMLKKIPQQKLSTKKLWRVPAKKYQKRNLYERYFGRDIPTPRKYSIWREISTKEKKRKPYKKTNKKLSGEKIGQRNLCIFSREISTKQNVKRYSYLKIREEKSLPKNVWRDISTKKSQETSPAKNLRREIYSKESLKNKSTKSLKRNLYQNNSPKTSPKFLSREISTKQAFERFFSLETVWRNAIPKEPQGMFYQITFQ